MFEDYLIIHLAYFITFVALAIRDVLFLRIVLSFANILQVVYQYGFNENPDIGLTCTNWNISSGGLYNGTATLTLLLESDF